MAVLIFPLYVGRGPTKPRNRLKQPASYQLRIANVIAVDFREGVSFFLFKSTVPSILSARWVVLTACRMRSKYESRHQLFIQFKIFCAVRNRWQRCIIERVKEPGGCSLVVNIAILLPACESVYNISAPRAAVLVLTVCIYLLGWWGMYEGAVQRSCYCLIIRQFDCVIVTSRVCVCLSLPEYLSRVYIFNRSPRRVCARRVLQCTPMYIRSYASVGLLRVARRYFVLLSVRCTSYNRVQVQ